MRRRSFRFRAGLAKCLVLLTVFLLGWALPAAQETPARQSIRVVMDDDYPPYIFRAPDGTLKGILVDQWALWEQKTGIRVRLDAMAWAEALRRMDAGDYDVIDTLFASERRRSLYEFTRPYARVDVPIFFSKDLAGIRGVNDLAGFIVGAKRGDNSVEILKAHGISNILLFDSYEAIAAAARDGKIKVFTVDQPPALYYLIRMGIQDQFRATAPIYSGELHRAVAKGDSRLLATVQQGFDAISRREYAAIDTRWHGTPIFTRAKLNLAGALAAGVVCLLLILIAARNIAQRKRAEAALDESERITRTISNNFTHGMIYQAVVDRDGQRRFAYLSSSVKELYGVSPREAMADASLIYNQIHEDDIASLIQAENEAIKNLSTFKAEARVHGPHGEIRWSSFVSTPRAMPDGSTYWDGVEFIITERKLAEEVNVRLLTQLQQTQKMESLGSLAGGIAHDMNNVLGAILALASANLDAQPTGSPGRRAFETIATAAVRGGKMVQGLLGFARQQPAEERELDLNTLLRDEVHLLERTTLAKVQLELDLLPGLGTLRGDPGALSNAIMNLCVNAVDAMPGQGRLLLRTRNLEDGRIELLVQDTGCGMTRAVLERAMDPFYTTKEVGKGTGLGLSLVYSTIKAHHGQIELHSEPGRGTSVRLVFPASRAALAAAPLAAGSPRERQRRTLQVLLVDDDELILGGTRGLLEVLGHTVRTASTGEEALAELAGGWQPEVVILDLNMPGMGGSGTLPRLRELLPAVPVLLATGRVDQTALDLVKAHHGVAMLSKPYSMADLQAQLSLIGAD